MDLRIDADSAVRPYVWHCGAPILYKLNGEYRSVDARGCGTHRVNYPGICLADRSADILKCGTLHGMMASAGSTRNG